MSTEVDSVETPAVGPTDAKPKRARKAKAAKPPVEKKPRAKPRTLAARVRDMGPRHEDALGLLSKKDGTFKAELRAALDHESEIIEAQERVRVASAALESATDARDRLIEKSDAARAVVKRLDETAAWLVANA